MYLQDIKQKIPSVDRVLRASSDLIERWGRPLATAAIREQLDRLRHSASSLDPDELEIAAIHSAVVHQLEKRDIRDIRTVINLSGVVLHTNLGRACLPPIAAQAAAIAAQLPNNLEFDLGSGKRGNRDDHIEPLICELTGAEAATVVNNNAAAVVLALNTLARGREVPVSRGELVEIGGSFRMPEVMAASGCTLVEVGATNRTHLKDYQAAVNEHTALLMKVHTSNYRVEGFTQSVSEQELCELAHQHSLPCMLDLGSGCLIDLERYGLPTEPKVSEYIDNGIDLLTFSGDKLLGGPQCGIIIGGAQWIDKINENPLKRALRVDSMTLAALAEVLKLYRHPETLKEALPTLRLLTRPAAQIEAQASRLCARVTEHIPAVYQASVQACASQIGSGALPVETIPSFAVAIRSLSGEDRELRKLAKAMRELPRPVIGRLSDGEFLMDMRCLEDEAALLAQLPLLGQKLAV